MTGAYFAQLKGQALWDCRSKLRLDGEYFEMGEPPIAGLTVESVESHPGSVHIRFSDGSALSVGGDEGVHVLYLVETGRVVAS